MVPYLDQETMKRQRLAVIMTMEFQVDRTETMIRIVVPVSEEELRYSE